MRDYGYKDERYLPCVFCIMKQFDRQYEIKRRIGVVEHLAYSITKFDYEKISNQYSFDVILKFIGKSKIKVFK